MWGGPSLDSCTAIILRINVTKYCNWTDHYTSPSYVQEKKNIICCHGCGNNTPSNDKKHRNVSSSKFYPLEALTYFVVQINNWLQQLVEWSLHSSKSFQKVKEEHTSRGTYHRLQDHKRAIRWISSLQYYQERKS